MLVKSKTESLSCYQRCVTYLISLIMGKWSFFQTPNIYNCLDYVCIVPQGHRHLQHGDPENYSTHVPLKNTVKTRLSSMSQAPKQWLSGKQGIKKIHQKYTAQGEKQWHELVGSDQWKKNIRANFLLHW